MSSSAHDIIQKEIEAYRAGLSPPDPVWPTDVRIVAKDLHEHLLEPELLVKDVVQRCGTCDHNISSRFAVYVEQNPKAYLITHRMTLAKRLLRHEQLQGVRILRIALAAGYDSQSGFTKMFKEYEGCTPGEYRKHRGRKK